MTESAQKQILQLRVKRKTEPLEQDLEADLSIEKDFIKLPDTNENVTIELPSQPHKCTQVSSNTPVNKNVLEKAGFFSENSWDEMYTYIRSFTGQSLESLESYISTFTDVSEGQSPENNQVLKKKWVIYDLVKLGLNEEQIREALKQLDALSDHMTKEDMIKSLVEKITVEQNNCEAPKEIRSGDDIKLEVNPPETPVIVPNWKIPTPPPSSTLKPVLAKKEIPKEQPKVQPEEKRAISLKEITEVKKPDELPENSLPKFECPICFNLFPEKLAESFLKCGHSFCEQCYKTYLQEQLQVDKILNIVCPYDGCQEKFQDECILKILDEDDALKYKRLKKNALLNQNPNLKWCVRPGCEKYVIGQKGKRKLVCECGAMICFKCGNTYHSSRSCDTVIDKVYKKYAQEKNVQNCPRCKSRIEKIEGCNHITCSICTYQWCWLCRREYTSKHYSRSNAQGCPGLQNADKRPPMPSNCLKNTKLILIAIGYLLVLPFAAILVAMNMPNWLYDKHIEKKHGRRSTRNPNNDSPLRFGLCLLGVVAFPIFLICLIIYGIRKLFTSKKPKDNRNPARRR